MLTLIKNDSNVIDFDVKRRERELRRLEQEAIEGLRAAGHPSVYDGPPSGGAA